MEIQVIRDKKIKREICIEILRDLPEWFGIEASLLEYIQGVEDKEFYTALVKGRNVGFFSVKTINDSTAELYVNGILREFHRQGVGRRFIQRIEEDLRRKGFKLLMVKTIGESLSNLPYSKTRSFYRSMGFLPLEEIEEIWGTDNPCLIMVKPLS